MGKLLVPKTFYNVKRTGSKQLRLNLPKLLKSCTHT